MVYLTDPDKEIIPQLKREVAREIELSNPAFILVAASTPDIVEEFIFSGLQTIFVLTSEKEPVKEDFARLREDLAARDIKVLLGRHLLKDVHRSLSKRYRTPFPVEIMAATLAKLPESVKHAVENAVLAVDKNLINPGVQVISIAGSNDQPDTAVLLEPRMSRNMIDTNIIRIISQPYKEQF